jgi:hypothetical protein
MRFGRRSISVSGITEVVSEMSISYGESGLGHNRKYFILMGSGNLCALLCNCCVMDGQSGKELDSVFMSVAPPLRYGGRVMLQPPGSWRAGTHT